MEEEAVATTSHEVITTLDADNFAPYTGKELIVKQGYLDHRAVNIMLYSGATCNVFKPALMHRVISEVTVLVHCFDGTNTIKKKVNKGVANIACDGYHVSEVHVIEWPMNNSHDIMLGKPWLLPMIPSSIGAYITCHSNMVPDHRMQCSRQFLFPLPSFHGI